MAKPGDSAGGLRALVCPARSASPGGTQLADRLLCLLGTLRFGVFWASGAQLPGTDLEVAAGLGPPVLHLSPLRSCTGPCGLVACNRIRIPPHRPTSLPCDGPPHPLSPPRRLEDCVGRWRLAQECLRTGRQAPGPCAWGPALESSRTPPPLPLSVQVLLLVTTRGTCPPAQRLEEARWPTR